MRRIGWATAAVLVLLAVACGRDAPEVFGVEPAQAAVPAGGVQAFAALAAPAPVVWSVAEPNGGTVSSTGIYQAPTCAALAAGAPSVVHVTATAGGVTATATVSIVDGIASVTIDPSSATVGPNGTFSFRATVTTTCGVSTTSSPT